MAVSKLTPDQQADLCVDALKKAKTAAQFSGRKMPWAEVHATIVPFFRPRSSDDADSPFGSATKIPPRPDWVTAYSASIGYPMDGGRFCDSYEQKGWKVGKSRMKNWQAACRNWKTNGWGEGGVALAGAAPAKAKDYSKL